MIRIFTQLDSLKASISNLLENCWYSDSFIAKEIGMPEAKFSSKKTKGNWTEKELQKLIEFFTIANSSFEDERKM
ncbi:MAG TPA: hypothetical protein VHZ50_07075 [Puia sp.]|jgi:hypothetical protein|nr:hypothetical protein [Puia sp.]